MLTTQKVLPLDVGVTSVTLDTTNLRTFRVALSEQAIFVLAGDRGEDAPEIVRVFILDSFVVTGSVFKWSVTDDRQRFFDGRHQPVTLYRDWFTMAPVFPLVILPGDTGFRVMFECKLPVGYRVHHASYVKRRWPELSGRRL